MKKLISLIVSFIFISYLTAQNCVGEMESLKGAYTCECKKGKAVGADTYEGVLKRNCPKEKAVIYRVMAIITPGSLQAG